LGHISDRRLTAASSRLRGDVKLAAARGQAPHSVIRFRRWDASVELRQDRASGRGTANRGAAQTEH
jgi:hypothetical protein